MSIFRPEIVAKFEGKIKDVDLSELEKTLRQECKEIKIPYTRQFLKTILHSVRRFVVLGNYDGANLYGGAQIMYVLAVEKLLERQEKMVADTLKKNENLLP